MNPERIFMNTTDEQIKIVEEMCDALVKLDTHFRIDSTTAFTDALTAILTELRESRELLEVGQHFKFGDHSIRLDHHGRFRLARISSGREIDIFNSALDAFAEVKKQDLK